MEARAAFDRMGPDVCGRELNPLKDLWDVRPASFPSSKVEVGITDDGREDVCDIVGEKGAVEEMIGDETELLSTPAVLFPKNSLSMMGPPAEEGAEGCAVRECWCPVAIMATAEAVLTLSGNWGPWKVNGGAVDGITILPK